MGLTFVLSLKQKSKIWFLIDFNAFRDYTKFTDITFITRWAHVGKSKKIKINSPKKDKDTVQGFAWFILADKKCSKLGKSTERPVVKTCCTWEIMHRQHSNQTNDVLNSFFLQKLKGSSSLFNILKFQITFH